MRYTPFSQHLPFLPVHKHFFTLFSIFSAEVARYIKERRWAKVQTIIDEADGSVVLELKTSGWYDVKKWVLSFGSEAELLEPEALRQEVLGVLSDAVLKYQAEITVQEG